MDRHAEVAYESIAPVYDDFTAHHDYEARIAMLLELATDNGLRAGASRALDVGCGTGKSFRPLLDRGWEVTACDISASMAALARERAGDRVRIEIADMRELPVLGSFDIAFCIDDAVNYLHSPEELTTTLRAVAANLEPDGVLIFDTNTISIYRSFFAESFEVEANGVRMFWEGHGDGTAQPGAITEASFSFEPLEGGTAVAPEVHRQRHHPEPEVRAAIDAAGLELAGLYGHGPDGVPSQPMSEDAHTKAIYVARKRRTT
ncbi:MAG TPA: methyltransferase domain-containing protein [Solirubrobacterales bacterium]|nr:methyltransferase domain-containing protein [Solirubrobacterales bacterium]